jgi:hypothetical protein
MIYFQTPPKFGKAAGILIRMVRSQILPDIPVEQSYSACLAGRDNVLERAIKELNGMMAESAHI